MTNVVQFNAGIVGDGAKIDSSKIIDNLKSYDVNRGIECLVVVYIDADGFLQCASTDGRAEALMLMERAKVRLIAGYED